MLYPDLLDLAHRSGLRRIATTLLQAPGEENGQRCICRDEVETDAGSFAGIGVAMPASVGRAIMPHLARMAATRALACALRDALNVGGMSLAELEHAGDRDGDRRVA